MIYAVYRLRYGEDFIVESIKSIIKYVDKIFIFHTTTNFGGVKECVYKGRVIQIPETIDDCERKVVEYAKNNDPMGKIELRKDNRDVILPDDQFGFYARKILNEYPHPHLFMFIEHDMVWREDLFEKAVLEAIDHRCSNSRQIELWKTPFYRIPERKRYSCIFWNMIKIDGEFPKTNKSGSVPSPHRLKSYVYNFGFCIGDENMYWKHLLAIAFSKKIGDSEPNENWYEEKWMNWDIKNNNKNLEIAKGYEYKIPHAIEYNCFLLPLVIKEKYDIVKNKTHVR